MGKMLFDHFQELVLADDRDPKFICLFQFGRPRALVVRDQIGRLRRYAASNLSAQGFDRSFQLVPAFKTINVSCDNKRFPFNA